MRVIKALSKSDYERARFKKVNDDLTEKERTAESTMALINPVMSLLLNLGIVAVITVGAVRVNNGTSDRQDHRVYEFIHHRFERFNGD